LSSFVGQNSTIGFDTFKSGSTKGALPLAAHAGVFLLQLTSATGLTIEAVDGPSSSDALAKPWAFSSEARRFQR
jgi:hypothetical protein